MNSAILPPPTNTTAKMSDGEVEVEAPQGYPVLPKDVTNEIGTTKLFNKWSYEDVEIRDISLTYVFPHTYTTMETLAARASKDALVATWKMQC